MKDLRLFAPPRLVQDGPHPRDEKKRQRLDALIPDMIRRTFYAGVGAVFTSEEGLRRLAQEFSLPKDVVNYLIGQAQNSKSELFRMVSAEVRSFLQGLDPAQELKRLLTGVSLQVKTEIRFVPKERGKNQAE